MKKHWPLIAVAAVLVVTAIVMIASSNSNKPTPADHAALHTPVEPAAAPEIPQTIAQMPCYCHCDRGMGHKSLYSCFQDDHASHCGTCVNEALLAFKLEKEGKLTPAQIRDRIVQQFGD
jgi:uncharacterized protein with PCYCGC motif